MPSERPAIIAQSDAGRDWQPSASALVTDSTELFSLLGLDQAALPAALAAQRSFAVKVPRSYVRRIRPGDPQDPLLQQVLGQAAELEQLPGYSEDPLAEAQYAPAPGILHKYQGRVLLMVTGACAIHCRYCFRRHFPYEDHVMAGERLQQAFDWLRGRDDISEVILSGGDPLSLSDRRLRELLGQLATLGGLQRLRLHTRLPVVMPERISESLLSMLAAFPLPVAIVVHANHAQELGPEQEVALAALRGAGVTLLNQSVLLCGVNDDAAVLAALSGRLYQTGVLPYYLHQLDAVQGAGHFAVTDARALQLHGQLRATLPGYLVPRLVRERPGEKGKSWLSDG